MGKKNNPTQTNNNRKKAKKKKVYDRIQGYWFSFQHIKELKAQPQGYRTAPIIKNSGESKKDKGIDRCPRIFQLLRDIGNDVDSM